MPESFGARLRQQREQRQIALASVADDTKIGLSLLEGLERDDLSHWPTGIFRRSFVRAYAQSLRLEPDAILREFLELYPDPIEVTAGEQAGTDREPAGQRPPTRLGYLVASTIGCLPRLRSQLVQALEPAASPQAAASTEAAATTEAAASTEVAASTEEVRAVDHPEPVTAACQPELELADVAHLCTELGRVLEIRDVAPLLGRAATILDAIGLIVWVWDPQATALKPALAHGYSDDVLARLPRVRRDTDNATAASFRSGETRIVNGTDLASGAVVVPLLTPAGCEGVLAVELRQGGEQRESVRALATIFAAQLATFVGSVPLAQAANA
jgi:transcriptional regulator with XRE-family HTH domain